MTGAAGRDGRTTRRHDARDERSRFDSRRALETLDGGDPANRGPLAPRAILYGYVARELFRPTALALAIFTAVVLTRDLPAHTELIINRGAGTAQVAWILACQSVAWMCQMLPFAVLVGGLVGLGRLVADREILILAALGFAPRGLLGPVALFGGGMACLTLALSLVASPMAQREMNRSIRALADRNPFTAIVPDVVHRFGEWKLEAREVSRHGQSLGRVLLWMPSVGETIFARTARLATRADGEPELELHDGLLLTHTRENPRAIRFEQLRAALPDTTPAAGLPFEDRLKSAPPAELAALLHYGEADAAIDGASAASAEDDPAELERRRRQAAAELQRRFAFPAATGLLAVLALPLALGRRGTSRSSGAVLGVAITIGYYGLVQVAEGIAQRSPALSALSVWLPNAVLLVITALLFFQLSPPRGRRRAAPAASKAGGATAVAGMAVAGGADARSRRARRLRVRRWALSRYVAIRFAQLAIASLTALVVAYLLVDVLERLEWFARHAARFEEIAHFYSARIPLLVSRVTPMGLVVAMALTVSLLTSTGELLGMRTLGISAGRALRPALGLCLLAIPLSFLLNDQIVPRTNELADMIKQNEIKRGSETRSDRTAVWGSKGKMLHQLEHLDAGRGSGRDVILYERSANGLPIRRIDARAAHHVGGGHWQLQDATAIGFEDPDRLTRIAPPAYADFGDSSAAELDLMHLSVAELLALIRDVAADDEPTTDLVVDLHVKLATPIACFILPALVMLIASSGPPFPGSAMTLISAGAIAIAYTLLAGAFASFGRGGLVWPWLGGWGPNLIVIAGLIGLTWRDRLARSRVRG
ncbi:MAG: LptF/LptG family permease [Myxococcota bacterium]